MPPTLGLKMTIHVFK